MDNYPNTPPKPAGQPHNDKPIEYDNSPIPFDDSDSGEVILSHTAPSPPLQLGGGIRSGGKIVSSERITGVKTFFTKLHGGALAFLDDQITSWLKENPGIVVKKTNTISGPVVGKTTEPNMIVTVWY